MIRILPGKLGLDYKELQYQILDRVLPFPLRLFWNLLEIQETSYICPGCGRLVILKYKVWGGMGWILEEKHVYEGEA